MSGLFTNFRPEVRSRLPALIGYRFVSNAGVRYPYSFLASLARGAGISVNALGWVLFVREITGVGAPLVGRLADRRGADRLLVGASILGAASLIAGMLGAVGLAVGLVAFGVAKLTYDVAMNAWIAEHVAYERRGQAIGMVEVTWAASALVALPLLGLLIDRVGWWAAGGGLAVLAVPLATVIFLRRPETIVGDGTTSTARRPQFTPGIIATLAAFCFVTSASQFLIVGHGLWLDDVYGLDPAQIGLAVMVVGAIEAVGSTGSSRFTDQWGKRRSVLGGTILMTLAMAALAVMPEPSLPLGLALLATAFLGFEFALVSALPLITELDPGARAQVMGWALGVSTALRAVLSPIGVAGYLRWGFGPLMMAAVTSAVLAIVLLAFVVGDPAEQ